MQIFNCMGWGRGCYTTKCCVQGSAAYLQRPCFQVRSHILQVWVDMNILGMLCNPLLLCSLGFKIALWSSSGRADQKESGEETGDRSSEMVGWVEVQEFKMTVLNEIKLSLQSRHKWLQFRNGEGGFWPFCSLLGIIPQFSCSDLRNRASNN